MPYNEAETRYQLIDPILRSKGYREWRIKLETPAPVEPTGDKGRRRVGAGRTDYLLCVQTGSMPNPLPIGVIEAKAEAEDPIKGMQQAKGYADCTRFSVQYVFSTNGHRYAEFDKPNQMPAGPFAMADFLQHDDLTQRYAKDMGIDLAAPESAMLFMADSKAYSKPRYYQDAAIRAAFQKILHSEQNGEPARVLLSLATGAGKTVIAANLLWRLHEAGRLTKPALFLCDRDELRVQAYNKLSMAFPKDSVRIVESVRGQNSAQNAKVHIATYQTLGIDEEGKNGNQDYASFLTEHYPPNAFSVIVIDECHRSAWGRWSEVLRRNPNAIQIGLTATPRQLRESKTLNPEDAQTTADNQRYFGEAVYEYTLIEAQEDGYLAACEIVSLKPSIDWKTFSKAEVVAMKPIDSRTGRQVNEELLRDSYGAEQFDNQLLIPERIASMCADLFQRLCENGGPEQKVIIFCNRDLHADRVAMQMQRLYAVWCKEHGQTPKDHYAFKCTSDGGSDLIESMRGSSERCFVACTVDLLGTGVDIERLNAVVFFRHLKSSITFYQMVGRGTRIHEETQKYKFWLYDYTGVTDLFGTDFITAKTKPKTKPPKPDGGNDGGDDEGGDEPIPVPEIMGGKPVLITAQGNFILRRRSVDGEMRDIKLPVEEYRKEMIQRVLGEANTIQDFRTLWVETQKRKTLIDHLLADDYSPETVRGLMNMGNYDHFDLFAHYGYKERALMQQERGAAFITNNQAWFANYHPNTAIVLRALGAQFSAGGTEALESELLWEHPNIKAAGGIEALRHAGSPAVVMMDAKLRLFGV
jgi:type I restriction enzyme, R subunit